MDKLTAERRSENMRRIKSKGMKPELAVRQLVHGLGYRYRLHRKDLPGKPDLVFGPARKAIFVHGCFWHSHETCRDGRVPQSNQEYWRPKLRRNKERDAKNIAALEAAGWRVLVIWECETRDTAGLSRRVCSFLTKEVPSMAGKYDVKSIEALLERVHSEIGDDRFSSMRLMELEKVIRSYDKNKELPGKTLLRATIHSFRRARWPGVAPKPSGSRFRY